MSKNGVYLAVFAVLCVLAGVLFGVGISRKSASLWGHERMRFEERAQRFMGQGPMQMHGKKYSEGIFEMFTTRLHLDAGQQATVKEILEKSRQEINEIGKNVHQHLSQIKERNDKQIMELLNPQQQEEFKVMLMDFDKRLGSKKMDAEHMMKKDLRPQPEEQLPPQH